MLAAGVLLVAYVVPAAGVGNDAPGSVVLPPNPALGADVRLLTTTPVVSFEEYTGPSRDVYRDRGDGTSQLVAGLPSVDEVTGNGQYAAWWDATPGTTSVTVYDMQHSSSRTESFDEKVLGVGADGSVFYLHDTHPAAGYAYEVRRRSPDEADTLVSSVGTNLDSYTFDATHAALQYDTYSQSRQVHVIDLATLADTSIAQDLYRVGGFTLTGALVSWGSQTFPSGHRIVRWAPVTGGAVQDLDVESRLPGGFDAGFSNGDVVAWYGYDGHTQRIWRAPVDGSSAAVEVPLQVGSAMLLDDGHLLVGGQTASAQTGVFDTTSDGTATMVTRGAPLPASVDDFAYGGGHVFLLDSSPPQSSLTDFRVTRVPGGLHAEPVRPIAAGLGGWSRTLGADSKYVAYAWQDGTTYHLTVRKAASVSFDGTDTRPFTIEGLTDDWLVYAQSGKGNIALNLATNTARQLADYVAVSGSFAYETSFVNSGQITRVNLATGVTKTVRAADGCEIDDLAAWHTLVTWHCRGAHGVVGPLQVLDTATQTTTAYPSGITFYTGWIGDHVLLARGTGAQDPDLLEYDLTSPSAPPPVLGPFPATTPDDTLHIDDTGRLVAWTASDNLVHVSPLRDDTSLQTFTARLDPSVGAFTSGAAHYFGVSQQSLGLFGAEVLDYISHQPGVALQSDPPTPNAGTTVLTTHLTVEQTGAVEDIAGQLGQTGDEMHALGADFAVYVWLVLGRPAHS